ncbi:conserved hypothetical protein [Talaromyces stipitatus ATCC 10500]|uniref:Proteophosphoglycan 5 n=1 Tax=Talaromyces stipitatus (strain ATCC 10500 / CBS 375.48 / QM 6759 / NRRL 1006) TaxID=441959 RepID=B8MC06_TALSN|nr:uncharacterized protein TSTA_121900 [Talaromyces stipitatus ATCC 10500]EED18452.1 conserved hypothetical protein [Talaromyces stipitatus ATCC 10500]
MSTPLVTTTPMKGSRNPKRQQRRNNTPASQGKTVMLSTPPSSPPRVSSPGDYFATGTPGVYNGDNNSSRKKNDNRPSKKSRENTRLTNAPHSNGPSIASPPQLKDSPHYAGPTFHASPAPSALPMPSFFSKSVPDSGLSAALELDDELDEESAPELTTPSKPKSSASRIKHEPSPLDFLFKAAIDARTKSQQSPEAVSKSTVSKSTDVITNQRQDSASTGIFSLELDGSERTTPTFSTPVSSYKTKMNALTSSGTKQHWTTEMDDAQRKMKTEELKHLLLNPRPQRPASVSPHPKGPARGYFHNAHAPQHAASGPPTPVSFNGHVQQNPAQCMPYKSPPQTYAENINPISFHRDVSPYASPVNVARANHYGSSLQSPFRVGQPSQMYNSPTLFNARLQSTPPSRKQDPDTKKMEDDLRRILKLDMAPSMQPNGVQSSLA